MTTGAPMSEQPPFNPSRFTDALTENCFAKSPEKREKLKAQREKRVQWLRKKYPDDKSAQALASKLEGCGPKHFCKSPACPECAGAGQRLFARIVGRFLKEGHSVSKNIVCVSIVPADGSMIPGSLSVNQHARNVRRWKDKLGNASVEWFVGATDYSFNEHREGRYANHWSEHIYGLTATNDPDELKRNLRKQFPKTDVVPRPVKVQEWDGDKAALRYALKPNSWRRVATDEGERFDKKLGGKRACRETDKQRLRSKHKRELLLHLDQIGMQGRLFLRWAQFVHLGKSGPAIVERRPKGRSHEN